MSLYAHFGEPVRGKDPKPGPGTVATFTIETIDNDVAAEFLAFDSSVMNPGTDMTATVETIDRDTAGEFGSLM